MVVKRTCLAAGLIKECRFAKPARRFKEGLGDMMMWINDREGVNR